MHEHTTIFFFFIRMRLHITCTRFFYIFSIPGTANKANKDRGGCECSEQQGTLVKTDMGVIQRNKCHRLTGMADTKIPRENGCPRTQSPALLDRGASGCDVSEVNITIIHII
jgi:hypothetical protein